MKKKLLIRLPFLVIGVLLAVILNQFTPPLTGRQYMWWMVAYVIIGIVITELLRTRKN
ncbi:hypothetical protein M3197_08735 [Sporosarcina aquimarina]|uniref:hypothetical protein n=1 Tax=Sporosarcina aquimarina TaxID=114975 RepID=UPI002040F055|nr:hypothetical protein [Sporosarcina aquimarina]MCM3757575.1 hypothetical protein [Sporosarcina aquimarina]